MARLAIISDVHGNLEALNAVLDDIDRQNVSRIICLGDTIGYGADPEDCLDAVNERCSNVLRGNHEDAVLDHIIHEHFRQQAADSIKLTRERMIPGSLGHDVRTYKFEGEDVDESEKERRWNVLRKMPKALGERPVVYVHGSPRDPIIEYLSSGDIAFLNRESHNLPEKTKDEIKADPRVYGIFKRKTLYKLQDNFRMIDAVCFNGHNHIPCVNLDIGIDYEPLEFVRGKDGNIRRWIELPEGREILVEEVNQGYAYAFPVNLKDETFVLGDEKAIVNVGSVGQPRNCDNRASYVVYDETMKTVEFRKIEYDIKAAAAKIRQWGKEGMQFELIEHSFDALADRLDKGE